VIRAFRDADQELVRRWHSESGFKYPLPDFKSPLCAVIGASEHRGRTVTAGLIKVIGESYLWVDPNASSEELARPVRDLQEALELDARAVLGLDHIICCLPPNVDKDFASQIERLGWQKSKWKRFAKNI